MANSSSALSSTLSRYRPAVLIITGLTAAYGVWFLQAHFASASEPPITPLRRRGAIRHGRRRGGRLHIGAARGEHQWTTLDDGSGQGPIGDTPRFEREVFGTYFLETPSGRQIRLVLHARSLPSIEKLESHFGFTRPLAIAERMEIENSYLDAMFYSTLPASAFLNGASRDGEMLREELMRLGFSETNINGAIERHNSGEHEHDDDDIRRQRSTDVHSADRSQAENPRTVEALEGRETTVGADSAFSWRGEDGEGSPREGQNLLNLLYHIAEDQARREGYVHRGVTCNSCGNMPIRGIRYRCANCIDYDLCETCEAMQIHHKTHLFYKVRIPAPFLGNPRQAQPVWYPGKPATLTNNVPRDLADRLMKETNFESPEIEALWDQYRCLAGSEWLEDPNDIGIAIDRRTFDKCFVPNTAIRPPPPNLIYDRMFAFYDTNCDGLIGFEEFIKGLASLNNKTKDERLKRIFQGYDIDNDGFVNRRDFLRMFRAFYALSKELTRDMVAGFDEDSSEGATTARDIVLGSQPISSAFQWQSMPRGEPSRGEGKRRAPNGDDEVVDGGGAVRENGDDRADPNDVVGDAAERAALGHLRPRRFWESMLPTGTPANGGPVEPVGETLADNGEQDGTSEGDNGENSRSQDEEESNTLSSAGLREVQGEDRWPPGSIFPRLDIQVQDVEAALGSYIAIAEIQDPEERAKVVRTTMKRLAAEDERKRENARAEGIQKRWRRRQFYLDEENGTEFPDALDSGEEGENEDAEQVAQINSHRSPRSRSSSKVRFEDDLMDPDEDIRSNPSTSSRSIPVGERWGGYEIPEVEKDVGKEILYQITQQGLNEMLDPLFKKKEDLAMEALATRAERKKWRAQIAELENQSKNAKEIDDGHAKANVTKSLTQASPKEDDTIVKLKDSLEKSGDSHQDAIDDKIHSGDGIAKSPSNISADHDENRAKVNAEDYPPADEELHSSVATFDNALSIESKIQEKPLNNLLEHAGFTVAESTSSSSPPSLPLHIEPPPDPTLPQNRPNSLPLRSPKLSTTTASSSTPAVPQTEPLAPSAPYKAPSTAAERLALLSASPAFEEVAPPRSRLEKLVQHDTLEKEHEERGGAGRLSFAEFEEIMKGEDGRRLGFVGAWIEMASF
ncbi:MAG: hypothetical protein M1812_006986 [Candelaria pacifica]|nr:MAG: hypothetical protein M1812_006986 [Candelaria pacifica]